MKRRLINIFNHYWLFLIIYSFILTGALLPFYQNNCLILGGEGNYWLDFSAHFNNYFLTWQNKGIGDFNVSLNTNFSNVIFFALLEKVIDNQQVINFILVFLIYYLPFWGMSLLCREFNLSPFIAFITSVFYVTNPFSLMFLYSLNQWNALNLFSLPLFFWIILKFYADDFKLFFYFGLASLLLAFTNVNPPLAATNLISITLAACLAIFFLNRKFSLGQLIKKYFLLALSFFLFNAWWLFNWSYIMTDVQKMYTKQFAISWLRGAGRFVPVLFRTLNLTMLFPDEIDRGYNFFLHYYTSPLAMFLLSIPLFIIGYFFWKNKSTQKHIFLLSAMLIFLASLVKGVRGLFGSFYEFAIMNVPFFSIFKTATEKWGVLYIFLLTLLLALILKELRKDRYWKLILTIFLVYLVFCLFPFFQGNFIPDYKIKDGFFGTRRYFDKDEYQDLREELNKDERQYRVLSLPGSRNYQIALHTKNKNFYTGLDPVLNNTIVPFIAPYSYASIQKLGFLFDLISQTNYLNLLGLYNVGKIVINKDIYPWFGFQEKESPTEIEAILDKNLESKKSEAISLYDMGSFFLPRYYIPEEIIYGFATEAEHFSPIISREEDLPQKSAFFLSTSSEGSDLVKENASAIIIAGENQSAIDEINLRTGVRDLNPEGVLFPYAKWKPGSFIYPLIQKKEERIKEELTDNRWLLAEQNVFFAGKRIYEIQRWEGDFSDKQFKQILDSHQKEMFAAIKNLESLTEEEVDTFMLLAKIEVSFEAYQKRLLDIITGNYGTTDNNRGMWAKECFTQIEIQLEAMVEKYFFYPKYYFKIPEAGEYEILVENTAISPDWQIEEILQNDERQIIGTPRSLSEENDWLPFGKKQFDQEEVFLELVKPPADNLISESQARGTSFSQKIRNLKPETIYRLSFNYRTQKGKIKALITEEEEETPISKWQAMKIEEPGEKETVVLDKELDSNGKWQDFKGIIKTSRKLQSLTIVISEIPDKEGLSQSEYKDAKFEAILDPKIILKKTKKSQPFSTPQIVFQKINPAKYLVEVKNASEPFFLIFSEVFHRGWQAYVMEATSENQADDLAGVYFNGEIKEIKAKSNYLDKDFFQTWLKKPLSEDQHLVMNNYANSWYITPEDSQGRENYQLIIEYWPQRLYYLGLIITILTIAFSLGIGFYRKFLLSNKK